MMLMSIRNMADVKNYRQICKDELGDLTSKIHGKGRSVTSRRRIKRAEKQNVRKALKNSDY